MWAVSVESALDEPLEDLCLTVTKIMMYETIKARKQLSDIRPLLVRVKISILYVSMQANFITRGRSQKKLSTSLGPQKGRPTVKIK